MRKINIRIQSKNKGKLAATLYQQFEKLNQASEEVLVEEANTIMQESIAEVPKKSGTLASIAGVQATKETKTTLNVKIGYGVNGDAYNDKKHMFASEYMMIVHENLDAVHTNGKAKFFEDPLNRGKVRIAERMKVVGRRYIK